MSAQIVQGPTAPTVVDSAQERSPRRLDGGGADAASARRGEHTSNAARATEEVRESDPANHAVVDSILFALGWIAVISLTFIMSDMLSMTSLRPVFVTLFLISSSYFAVLARWRHMANSAQDAAEHAMATGRRTTPVLGKEQRKALLTYFVFRGTPPEEEKQEAEAAGDGQSGGSPRTPALSPAPSPLPPPTTATTASLCAAAVACLTGDAEDEEAADHDDDIVDCEMGLSAATTDEEVSTSDHSQDTTVDRIEAETSSPAKDVLDHAKDGAKSVAQNKSCLKRGDSQQWSTTGACIVCFGDYNFGDNLCRLPCRHVYHAECIDEWLDRAHHPCCPLCKADLVATQDSDRPLASIASSQGAVHEAANTAINAV